MQTSRGENHDPPFFRVLVRDFGYHNAALSCKCTLIQEKRDILIKQVPPVPGKDHLFFYSATLSFLYGQINVPEGFRSEGLDLIEASNNETQGGKLTGA